MILKKSGNIGDQSDCEDIENFFDETTLLISIFLYFLCEAVQDFIKFCRYRKNHRKSQYNLSFILFRRIVHELHKCANFGQNVKFQMILTF